MCYTIQTQVHGNREASSTLGGSPMDILNSRIVDSDVKPTYRITGTDVTSYKTIYNYSCTLYGLYGGYCVQHDVLQYYSILLAWFFLLHFRNLKQVLSVRNFRFLIFSYLQTERYTFKNKTISLYHFLSSDFYFFYFLINFP